MKLILQSHGVTYTVETEHDDLTVGAVVEGLVRPALLAAGYMDKSIERSIGGVDETALEEVHCL